MSNERNDLKMCNKHVWATLIIKVAIYVLH